ncbi:MAG: sodium:solute symporter family protein [Ignavibacteriae bacterium]|nr:sodium:solute symporter family protein [Ignavibacteriota bacterium]
MISFSNIDILIVIGFLFSVVLIGFWASNGKQKSSDEYLLSGRKVGLSLFILTNVATWYGGILGVGEFSYRYGLVSWFTQGLPYYIFAIIFAFLFADKIRSASLFTITDKLEEIYGRKVSLVAAVLIFILVSPAPYLLMLGQIISIIFNIDIFYSLVIAVLVSSIYLFKGGYTSNIWADAFSFFVMFLGFIIIVFVAFNNYGGIEFLEQNLPEAHLSLTGGTSLTFIVVWFLIALWTFTDPGFHQRCYSAKSGKVAKWGILISVFFWAFFDFLTNTTGLFTKAILPNLENPVMAFPFLAEKILAPGLKGIFFAALIATILSTLNSFMFLSATTFSRDFVIKFLSNGAGGQKQLGVSPYKELFHFATDEKNSTIFYTRVGIVFTAVISLFIAYSFESIVEMWYTIGSICIPGLILLVVSSYYHQLKISSKIALYEITIGVFASITWILVRENFTHIEVLSQIEPMIVGLTLALLVHIFGKIQNKNP